MPAEIDQRLELLIQFNTEERTRMQRWAETFDREFKDFKEQTWDWREGVGERLKGIEVKMVVISTSITALIQLLIAYFKH